MERLKKQRPRRKPTKPPPAGARTLQRGPRPGRRNAPQLQRELQYKVVELSTVDEGSLERTLNEWIARGWNLDGVQFAMRESSKRPAMAFVFFTREGPPAARTVDEARDRLARMAGVPPAAAARPPPPQDIEPPGGDDGGDAAALGAEENGAVRWVELPESEPEPEPGPDEGEGA
jgi:hypothetical protein